MPAALAFDHNNAFQLQPAGYPDIATGAYAVQGSQLVLTPAASDGGSITYDMTWSGPNDVTLALAAPQGVTKRDLKFVLNLHRTSNEETLSPQLVDQTKNRPLANNHDESADCVTNVKQLSLGLLMYTQDYDEVFPVQNWQTNIEPYVKKGDLFNCPAYVKKGKTGGYAISDVLLGAKSQDIHAPALEPAIFDANVDAPNATASINDLPNPPRHPQGNVIGYVDGHAKCAP